MYTQIYKTLFCTLQEISCTMAANSSILSVLSSSPSFASKIVLMWIVIMLCCNRSVLYKQIITLLQYAVNFYGFSHIMAKRRPCERALVWLEETNHISCLHPTSEACRREDGTQMWIRHACHPSRTLATFIYHKMCLSSKGAATNAATPDLP